MFTQKWHLLPIGGMGLHSSDIGFPTTTSPTGWLLKSLMFPISSSSMSTKKLGHTEREYQGNLSLFKECLYLIGPQFYKYYQFTYKILTSSCNTK